jgi:SsrA-binding protein
MKDLVSNRKAYHNYEILESFEAGIVLLGTEIKSLRSHGGSLNEAYATVKHDGQLWLVHSYIAPYKFGSSYNHEETRERKLLMHKQEILKLKKAVSEKGLTIIPLAFFLKKGLVKVKIALGRGKKSHDKRRAIKEKEEKRSMQKFLKR